MVSSLSFFKKRTVFINASVNEAYTELEMPVLVSDLVNFCAIRGLYSFPSQTKQLASKMTDPFKPYIQFLQADLARGNASEHTHRLTLKTLLESLGERLTATI
jgi:hypothetical protein